MSIAIISVAIAAIILASGGIYLALEGRGEPDPWKRLPPATPGSWYGSYHAAWNRAHPGAWERGESQCGGFYKGDVWGTSTLDWDQEWFGRNGMSLPRQTTIVDGRKKPGTIRIGTLGPGESVSLFVEGER